VRREPDLNSVLVNLSLSCSLAACEFEVANVAGALVDTPFLVALL